MNQFFSENDVVRDSLTTVYAKESIEKYVNRLIHEKIPFTYALIDIDNFTYINDTFGEVGGNAVLMDVAATLLKIIGKDGVVGRNEGDEFVVVLKNIVTYDEIWNICHNILVKINEIELPQIGSQTLTVTIGLDRFPENAENFDELKRAADKALFRGKAKGRNCFIIYLPEKHESIVPKTEKQKVVGSINLHSSLFKFLTTNDDLAFSISNLINFMSSYFTIDHICIQTNTKLLFQKIHQMSKCTEFIHVPHDLILANINKSMEMFYLSDIKSLQRSKQTELYEIFERQKITSSCFCDISYRNEHYGMFRADMTGTELENRLWQYSNMDLLLTAAKTIGLILHYTGKTLEDIAQE